MNWKKTEFWVSMAGLVSVVATSVMESGLVASGSVVGVVLSIAIMVASYVAGRSWVKAAEAQASANDGVSLKTMLHNDDIRRALASLERARMERQ